ncbi:MAG: hypothetical protein ABI673_11440 [Novosphingobium sp.]
MREMSLRRMGAIGLAAGLALLLSACLLAPGKFTSTLDLRRDGRFSYAYKGEIFMLGLSKLAEMGRAEANKPFTGKPCEDDNMDARKCTAAELAEQKSVWAEEQRTAADKAKRDAESMKAMMGGIDPTNPKAAEELAARLRRQVGWRSVVYKGDGLYLVDFAITGRIDHDFTFPTIERFPLADAFVQLTRRNDGTVRMDAPGFAPSAGGSPFAQMMGGGMMGGLMDGASSSGDKSAKPGSAMPVIDGQFTLTTDGDILANNTDEGPQADTTGKRLQWTVSPRTTAAPTALVKLGG